MFCQHFVCQGEGYTLTFISTHTHCHLSIAPSLASVTSVCLSRNPTKLAGVQHQGLSPRRLGRGPGSSCELFLGMDLGSTSLVSFCLIHSPLAHPGLLFSLIPLSGTLWLMSLSFNYQHLLLSLARTHTRTRTVDLDLCKLACVSVRPQMLRSPSYTFTICSVLLV